MKNRKIIVAMSGGVDSSVAAALLAREGYEVIGVTLRLLGRKSEGFGCCGNPEDMAIAKRSAEKAGIPHYVLDYSPDFERDVMNPFVNAYLAGETPNPCLACNRTIKFNKLKDFSDSIGVSYLATGHYARILPEHISEGIRYHLYESCDATKDQSYVLFNLNQELLKTTSFPVGNKTKLEIRRIARDLGLPNADKKDSQEICFVPGRDYGLFLRQRIQIRALSEAPTTRPGPIQNTWGETIGEHKGVAFYTVGQRKGLGLTTPHPLYVTRLDAKENTVVVGRENESFSSALDANDLNWVLGAPPGNKFKALVKIRYKHEPTPATVTLKAGGISVSFDTPQRAVSPGQAAVFYRWDESLGAKEVLGGGKIVRATH